MGEKSADLLQGTLDLMILRVLSLEPTHGWGIGERLVITEKTAGHHVSNIFCKLGVHNRAQAVGKSATLRLVTHTDLQYGDAAWASFEGRPVWHGIVYVFDLGGHRSADRCYAWSSRVEGSDGRRFFAVLHTPPIASPADAVRAAILHETSPHS